jgi:hypothetical protein
LARGRDRRIRRLGKYFATMSLGGGWRATCALALERRHVFPEPDQPDRTIAEWKAALGPILAAVDTGTPLGPPAAGDGFRIEMERPSGLLTRLRWTLGGSPHSRAFADCHRQRHRDHATGLVLGYAEHRKRGLIDATLLLLPNRDGPISQPNLSG